MKRISALKAALEAKKAVPQISTSSFNKISLNGEGLLLHCILPFEGKFKRITDKSGRNMYIMPVISKDSVVLFLGCWHYKMKLKPPVLDVVAKKELTSPIWTTCLRFLSGQDIVKVDWHGNDKLDQLYQAASFIYKHFRLCE